MRTFRPALGIALLSLALAFLISEAILRLFNYQVSSYGQRYGISLVFDRSILFYNAPSSSSDIDPEGRRVVQIPPLSSELPQILLLGDSFTFGVGVGSNESFPSRLQARLGQAEAVFNYGVIGYGPDQSLLQLERLPSHGVHDTVILSLFAGNDFEDVIKNHLFTLDSAGALLVAPENILTPFLPQSRVLLLLYRGFYGRTLIPQSVMNMLFEDAEVALSQLSPLQQHNRIALLRAILVHTKSVAAPSQFYVNLIPPAAYYRAPHDFASNVEAVRDLCAELGITLISADTVLDESSYLAKDGHLTPEGNERVAEEIAKFIFAARQ